VGEGQERYAEVFSGSLAEEKGTLMFPPCKKSKPLLVRNRNRDFGFIKAACLPEKMKTSSVVAGLAGLGGIATATAFGAQGFHAGKCTPARTAARAAV
jgi:hypothetical protein